MGRLSRIVVLSTLASGCGGGGEDLGQSRAVDPEPSDPAGGGGVSAAGGSGGGAGMGGTPSEQTGEPQVEECTTVAEDGARWVALVTGGSGSRLLRVGASSVTCPEPLVVTEFRVLWSNDGSALSSCGFDTDGPAAIFPFVDDSPEGPMILTERCRAHVWAPTRPVLATCEGGGDSVPRQLDRCVIAEVEQGTVEAYNVLLPEPVVGGGITWSPTGDRFAVSGSTGAHVIDVATRAVTVLRMPEGDTLRGDCRWSPSGTRLACGAPFDVMAADLTTSPPTYTIVELGTAVQTFDWVDDENLVVGTDVLESFRIEGGLVQDRAQIHDAGVFSQWHATAYGVAVTGSCGGGMGLCTIGFSEAGAEPARLLQTGTYARPQWSPDGAHLTFVSGTPDRMLITPVGGGAPRTLAADENAQAFFFPTGEWIQTRAGGDREAVHVPSGTRTVIGRSDLGEPGLAGFANDLEIIVTPISRSPDTLLAVGRVSGDRVAAASLTRIDDTYLYALVRPRW